MTSTPTAHILIVDDDPQIRQLLQEYFQENQLRVSTACNSHEMTALIAEVGYRSHRPRPAARR